MTTAMTGLCTVIDLVR